MNSKTSASIKIMRVVGMLYVALGNHYLPLYFPGFVTKLFGQFFGFVGVGMFFAVSGYIFGCKARDDSRIGTMQWFVRRLKRILIPYWMILALVIAIRLLRNQSVTWRNVITSVLNLQGILQLRYAFPELGHTWFISIVMVCYLLICVWTKYKDSRTFWKIHWAIYIAAILLFALDGQLTSASYTGSVLLSSVMYCFGYHGNVAKKCGGGHLVVA